MGGPGQWRRPGQEEGVSEWEMQMRKTRHIKVVEGCWRDRGTEG